MNHDEAINKIIGSMKVLAEVAGDLIIRGGDLAGYGYKVMAATDDLIRSYSQLLDDAEYNR